MNKAEALVVAIDEELVGLKGALPDPNVQGVVDMLSDWRQTASDVSETLKARDLVFRHTRVGMEEAIAKSQEKLKAGAPADALLVDLQAALERFLPLKNKK